MNIEINLSEAMWEADYQVILRTTPLGNENIALHLFKLGMQAYRKEMAGGLPQDEISTKVQTVAMISAMTQRLIDHYRKHNLLAEELRRKVKNHAEAIQAVKEALLLVEQTQGSDTVKLFKQEIFMAGIGSIFPEIDEILGGPKVQVPKPGLVMKPNMKPKKRRGGKR